MIELLKNTDTQLFLFINSHHCIFCDFIFYWASEKWIWIPFYLFLTYVLYKKFGSEVWKVLLSVGVLILLSDQISVFIKDHVMRYRPCHNLVLQSSVHLVEGKCGGQYGFISSHATNSFALAAFLILLLRKRTRWLITVLAAWCFLIAYSRIYLAQHYPMDLLGGWILGLLLAMLIYGIYRKIFKKNQHEN